MIVRLKRPFLEIAPLSMAQLPSAMIDETCMFSSFVFCWLIIRGHNPR